MRTQLVWQQHDEKSGKYVYIVSCFESTKYTCLGCMNYFYAIFLFSRRQVRTGRGTMMFIWKRSNNRREAKYNTCLLLAARLFNAYYILSRLLLPSFITLAKKNKFFISTIFLPHFFPAILVSKPSDRNKVAFTFPLEFDLIRFDV